MPRALLSVSDKSGLIDFARGLQGLDWEIISTGGTAKAKVELVEGLGGVVVGIEFVIELTFLHGRDKLAGYDLHSLITY